MLSENGIIPAIDLARSGSGDRAELRRACETIGVFYVTGHGVPAACVESQFELARSFFALDFQEKCRIEVDGSNCFRGYEPFGSQTIDTAAPGDLKEGFIAGPDLAFDHAHVVAGYPNTGPNRWPERPAGMRTQMEVYIAHMNQCGRLLAAQLALALELEETYFAEWLAEPLTYSQLFHYPPLPAGERRGQFGAGAHTDWGMLTLLLQDDVGGLEVRDSDGEWMPVTPRAGTFVAIVGELMLRLTDGRFHAAEHRVAKNANGRSRYSMPTFIDPPYDQLVGCVPTCTPVTGAARFEICTVSEHMRAMRHRTLSAQMTQDRGGPALERSL